MNKKMTDQLSEVLLQALTHEKGGVLVYESAIACAKNKALKTEWKGYLKQTEEHVRILTELCGVFDLNPKTKTPGCRIVELVGKSLVKAMELARAGGDPSAAQLVACDCVVLAETKDHANWELLAECAKALGATEQGRALKAAVDKVEDEEDEHLYHTKGWCREMWLASVGLKASLPPPEEAKDVKTAIAAAETGEQRKKEKKA